MTPTEDSATVVWVCVDCYETPHGVRDAGREAPDRVPLNLIRSGEVSSGMLWVEHAADCPNRLAGENVDECECERLTFSRTPCEGCGSTLGGGREALTVWNSDTEESR